MARLFGVESFQEYKKLTAFLRNHGLLVEKKPGGSAAKDEDP
jgi:hypothetical protein